MMPTVIKSLRYTIFILTLLCSTLVPLGAAHAITTQDKNCTIENGGCTFYIQDDCSADNATGTTVTLAGNDNEEKAFNFFITNLHLTAFQAAGIVGNFMQESSLDPNATNTKIGIHYGIAQWGGGRLTGPLGLDNFVSNHNLDKTKLATQLEFAEFELNGDMASTLSDLKKTTNVTDATVIFEEDYEDAGAPTDPGVAMQNRIGFAKAILAKDGKDAPGADTAAATIGTPDCNAGLTSASNSAIVQTALGLVWPTTDCNQTFDGQTRNGCFDPTNAYQTAWSTFDNASNTTDCGAFVATVMRKSKADTNYPVVDTITQYAYASLHTNLYQKVPQPRESGQLQPGDILIASVIIGNGSDNSGHTAIYVGQQGKLGSVAAASLDGHTPEMEGQISAGEVAFILTGTPANAFRLINNSSKVSAL